MGDFWSGGGGQVWLGGGYEFGFEVYWIDNKHTLKELEKHLAERVPEGALFLQPKSQAWRVPTPEKAVGARGYSTEDKNH
jgi:hypothetical protein